MGRDKRSRTTWPTWREKSRRACAKRPAIVAAEGARRTSSAFKAFIIGVARTTAEAAKGVDEHEAAAIKNLEAALG